MDEYKVGLKNLDLLPAGFELKAVDGVELRVSRFWLTVRVSGDSENASTTREMMKLVSIGQSVK